MKAAKADEHELKMRRFAAKLNGKPSFELLPHGALTCFLCKGPPSMTWVRSEKYWIAYCRQCDRQDTQPIVADTHALAIVAWNKRNWRADP